MVENSSLENIRDSQKEEITSEFKNLLAEPQKELLKLLNPKAGERIDEEEETFNEGDTPTKSVRIKSSKITTHVEVVTW